MQNYILIYNRQIQSGKVVACEKIKKEVAKLAEDCKKKQPYHFDMKKACRPIEFIEKFCKNSKGKWIGQPLKLTVQQKAFIQAAFGFVDQNGLRRYREVLEIEGRKNGKSVLLSAIGIYMMLADHEGGAEVDCVASKKDQARIVFDEARNMVDQSPYLKQYIKRRKSDIYAPITFSKFQPLASDSNTLDGLNMHCGIIDELHSIKDRNIYDVSKQSMTARRQPMLFIITTSGFNREGIYDDLYEYASGVIDGRIKDDRFLPFIYELDNESEWTDEKCWIKANPNLNSIKSLEGLRENVKRAKVDSSFRPTVMTKDFNVKQTDSHSWMSYEDLYNPKRFLMQDVSNSYALGGCDLSATTDLTCASLLIRRPSDAHIYVLQHYFLPESRIIELDQTSSHEAPYRKWEEQGLMTICKGSMVDYHQVTEWFLQMRDEYGIDVYKLGYDRAMSNYWRSEMEQYFGLTVLEPVAQGAFTWTAPMKELGAKLKDKEINYNCNPMLLWCMTNTAVKTSGSVDSIMPVKIQTARRIDGLVSLLNAYTIYCKYRDEYLNTVG